MSPAGGALSSVGSSRYFANFIVKKFTWKTDLCNIPVAAWDLGCQNRYLEQGGQGVQGGQGDHGSQKGD